MGTDEDAIKDRIKQITGNKLFATFNGFTSASLVGKGLLSGMIDVLPDESFLANCKDNSTNMWDSGTLMNTKFAADDNTGALTAL
jgi:hypothetical protein